MILYDYKILFGSGQYIELKDCSNRIELNSLTKNNWAIINMDNIGRQNLINMSQVLTIEETIRIID